MEKAIIMGAGPAGLTAAYELLTRTDIKPVIIEMDNQVGGLSKTVNYKGNLIDIGGHRFFSKSEKITDWWLQFLPLVDPEIKAVSLTYQNQTKELKNKSPVLSNKGKMLVRPRKSRIYFEGAFFDYPLSFNRETMRNFGIGKITRIVSSYLRSKLRPIRNEKTLEEFFINRFGRELYLTFFKGYTEKIWGVPCSGIPADWGHQRIKDLNIGKVLLQSVKSIFSSNKTMRQDGLSTSLIEQFLYPEKGPGQMWDTVAAKIIELGGEIRLNTRIEKISLQDNHMISSATCRDLSAGNTYELSGKYFFSTIPVKQLIEGLQPGIVPDEIKHIATNLQYRDFIIVGLLFKKPENNHGIIGGLTDNWIYLQDKNTIAGRLQIFNNWSPFMANDQGTVWVGLEYFCNTTDAIWNLDSGEMIQLAYEELKRTGLISIEELKDGIVLKVPKAYPSYIGTYEQFEKVQGWLDQFENLFLIGRNGMHRYNNTDHSMMTAMTAVDNIIMHQKSKANIWAVNMEKEFIESVRV